MVDENPGNVASCSREMIDVEKVRLSCIRPPTSRRVSKTECPKIIEWVIFCVL